MTAAIGLITERNSSSGVRTDWKKVGAELAATALQGANAGLETVKAAWEYARGNYLNSFASGLTAADHATRMAGYISNLWNWPRLEPRPAG